MSSQIPVFRPRLIPYASYSKRFEQIDKNRVYSNGGPQSQELIGHIARLFGVDSNQVVLGSSATLMLTGAAVVLGKQHWFVPSWTFTASALAVTNAGCSICFIDVDPVSHVAQVSSLPQGSNLLAVAPWGKSITIGEDYNRFGSLIIDAAASIAHPVQYSPSFSGLDRTIEVYSLHATKVLGIGEGGFAIVRDKKLAKSLQAWTNFGFNGERVSVRAGTNAKLSEYSAAIGCETFLQATVEFDEWRAVRLLAQNEEHRLGLSAFYSCEAHIAPYWILRVPNGVSVDRVAEKLSANGIDSRHWWGKGCHRMEYFQSCDKVGPLNGTKQAAKTSLGIPFSRDFSSQEFRAIGLALGKAL